LVGAEAVVVKVRVTVDPVSDAAVGVLERVEMRVVGSAVGAVEVRVMAGSESESGAWGLRLVSAAEASAAARRA
jgi:hypothetical protein